MVPSEKGTCSAVSGPSKGHKWCGELKKKGTISEKGHYKIVPLNGTITIKEAQHNQYWFFWVKRAGRHFSFLKRTGRHQKGAGRRAL